MSENNERNEPIYLLSDDEFARLMISEFSASNKKHHLLPHKVIRFQMLAWAAGLCCFLLYQPQKELSLEKEFFVGESVVPSQGRAKGGITAISNNKDIMVNFVLENESSTTESLDQEKLTALEITTTGPRYLRAEIHENGRLTKIRAFDPLAEPLHETQSALVDGKVWGYLLSVNRDLLICIKPADAPLPPYRLATAEMQKRATLFSNQCLFRARR